MTNLDTVLAVQLEIQLACHCSTVTRTDCCSTRDDPNFKLNISIAVEILDCL